jgi:endonuclease/exonuclease/phosphatase family metal-dependent hydrolase
MTLSLNENVLTVLFLFSPILLIFFKKNIPDNVLFVVGELMIVCRVLEPLFEITARMVISGLGVGCFMIFFPALFLKMDSKKEEQGGITLGIGLALAIASSVLLRTLNSTIDISTYSWFQVIGLGLAVIETIMLIGLFKMKSNNLFEANQSRNIQFSPTDLISSQPNGLKHVLGITFGLTSILFFISFAFNSPVVISRWTEGDYFIIVGIVVLMIALLTIIVLYYPQLISSLKLWTIWIWNGLFVLFFVLTIIVNQIPFPSTPEIYPIEAVPTTLFNYLPLILMLVTFPIILIDFMLLSREIIKLNPKPTAFTMGGSFVLGGGVYMLVMLLALIFTSTWGFIPLIGVFFRDIFWQVFLIVGFVVVVSVIRGISRSSLVFQRSLLNPFANLITSGLVVIIFVGTLASAIVIEAAPLTPTEVPTTVRFLTYNIRQGVNEAANKNYDGQLELIRNIDADIIGLQESSKIAGNSDVVRYFANKLNLHSYFGPKGVTGTTGVALLSKYPIKNPKTFYHFSENIDRKQTATVEAEITVGSRSFLIYVTHTFGRISTKLILQTDVLDRSVGKSNVIFMGDFNFRPNTEPYNLTTNVMEDSWWLKWPTGIDNQGNNNSQEVDLIFVSPGTTISDCQYIFNPQSDHPAYWADIQV